MFEFPMEAFRHLYIELYRLYTAKNDQVVAIVDENRIEQCFTAHVVDTCQQY
jgi:hypothetical protein